MKSTIRFAPHVGLWEKLWYYVLNALCLGTIAYLVLSILAVVPLSFNAEPFLVYPIHHYSLRWYTTLFQSEAWTRSIRNSLIVAPCAAVCATTLGTLCAFGLNRGEFIGKKVITGLVLSPLVVPLVVVGIAMYLFYMKIGMSGTYVGLIAAHTILGAPFVVTTVGATLKGFDQTFVRASASLGAGAFFTFRRVTLPLILPGVLSGAVFAFATSLDEVIITLFLANPDQTTIPVQMFSGIRDAITPTILALATLLIVLSTSLLIVLQALQRHAEQKKLLQV
jgi:putative spermidine/putrescine transport system permease protein